MRTPISIELHLLYLANTCLGTRPFHACQNFDPCDLDLDLKVCVWVSKSVIRFRKLYTAHIPIELHLLCLANTCLGTISFHPSFHPCQNFYPYDLDLRVCVSVSKSALRFRKLIIALLSIEEHLLCLAHTCLGARPFHACQNFDPCDLDLDHRVCVIGFEICI